MGFKDSLFKGVGSAGKGLLGGLGKVAAGIKTDNKMGSNISKIEPGVKRYKSAKPLTLLGAVGQVLMGSKVPKNAGIVADISGRKDWRGAQKKVAVQAKPEVVDRSAFANNKKEYLRKQSADWIAKELQSGNLKDLRARFFRYFGYLPRESDPLSKKLALAGRIFGSKKEPIGEILEKKSDTPLHLAQMKRKSREKTMPALRAKKDYRGIEQEKINQEILDRFFEGKKK
ncbi:MAG: hypothetical protein ABH813_00085 [Patescibacteria group bacterium]